VFAEQVRAKIEQHARQLADRPLLLKAREGLIGPDVVRTHLSSAQYLILHTQPHLSLAYDRAQRMGIGSLADYFREKATEELGHDAWARGDLEQIEARFGDGPTQPTPAIKGLMRWVGDLIAEDARLYLVYILFAEYFTVVAGPLWVDALTQRCGIPETALTVVSKHVEADAEHAREGFQVLNEYFQDESLQHTGLLVLDRIVKQFDRFEHELWELSSRPATA
jgi:hypothetical protein